MKKLVALMMALAMLLSVVSAVAEDAITLKIAHIGPTTGAAALYGLATLHGAEVAAAEINEAGGKYKVELINEDDEHNVEKVINAYNAALDAGAQMILGTTTSKPCEAAGAQGYTDRVFFLTPSASSTAVIEDKDNVFQICFTDPNQGKASAQYIAEHKLGQKHRKSRGNHRRRRSLKFKDIHKREQRRQARLKEERAEHRAERIHQRQTAIDVGSLIDSEEIHRQVKHARKQRALEKQRHFLAHPRHGPGLHHRKEVAGDGAAEQEDQQRKDHLLMSRRDDKRHHPLAGDRVKDSKQGHGQR